MSFAVLVNVVAKEFRLLIRDVHALLVLFLMPVLFIFIMSLSLQGKFEENAIPPTKLGITFADLKDRDSRVGRALLEIEGFVTVEIPALADVREFARTQTLSAVVTVPQGFAWALENESELRPDQSLLIQYAPVAPSYLRRLVHQAHMRTIMAHRLRAMLTAALELDEQEAEEAEETMFATAGIVEQELYSEQLRRPSSVEQTVPAWLIFSMFFVVIPLSTTLLTERHQGTMFRLKTMPVTNATMVVGKLAPYFVVNLIQATLMLLVGIYAMPPLGADGIVIGSNGWLLLPMTAAVSFAAISMAMLIATAVKTTEQATTIGGVSNLILGAIGGVMVPTFIMPETMQAIAGWSPMNWGLEGFLTVILREGTFTDLLPNIGGLLAFGAVAFVVASRLLGRSTT